MMVRDIVSEADLIQTAHSEKKMVIYGAGAVANHILDLLPADGRIEISAIAVTDREGNPGRLRGIPVCSVDQLKAADNTFILVAAGKAFQRDILNLLGERGYQNIGAVGGALSHAPAPLPGLEQRMRLLEDGIVRLMPQTRLRTLVVNILDHCNLNCWGCDHFAPIADKRCIPAETVCRDLEQMARVMGESVDELLVMGGEPLLHPELLEILRAARRAFEHARILISTNGLLLNSQEEEFWETCRQCRIGLNITKYPVSFDYEAAERTACANGVEWEPYSGYEMTKTLYHIPLDPEGRQDARHNFLHCSHANHFCNMLTEGKLFTCTIAPTAWIFSKKFGFGMELEEGDGLDIYSVRDKSEVFDYLCRPTPFCRYCNVSARSFGHPWRRSSGAVEEWTVRPEEE